MAPERIASKKYMITKYIITEQELAALPRNTNKGIADED